MTRTVYRLALALALSLLLHIAPFLSEFIRFSPPPAPPPPLRAELRLPAPALPAPPPLTLSQPESAAPPPAKKEIASRSARQSVPTVQWIQEVRKQFKKQRDDGLFYPAAAIAQGLEGEVLVLMILDTNGRVAAARVEQGSGQRLLDDAALRAVRALHSLPADAPRETLLPVRFRLR